MVPITGKGDNPSYNQQPFLLLQCFNLDSGLFEAPKSSGWPGRPGLATLKEGPAASRQLDKDRRNFRNLKI